MIELTISAVIKEVCPNIKIGIICCDVYNSVYNEDLWNTIVQTSNGLKHKYSLDDVKNIPAIKAIRETYKKTGKDPNRYRPAGEALLRRIINGKPLFQVNSLVDITNLVSLRFGYSVGGYDSDKIKGSIVLTIGKKGDTFNAIGKGIFNIDKLPVLRDSHGPIGSPTSGEERAAVSNKTKKFHMTISSYDGSEYLNEALNFSEKLLKKYCAAQNFEKRIVT